MDSPAKSPAAIASSGPDIGSNILARDLKTINRTPLVRPIFILGYYYLVGLVGLLFLIGFSLSNPQTLADMVKPVNLFPLICLSIASSICNFFPFRIPPGLYLALSMVLYLTSFLTFTAVPAAIPPIIGSVVFELYVVKRGFTFVIRTS